MEKTGRNDPCPCGSGKKSKKCCGIPKEKKRIIAQVSEGESQVQRISNLFNLGKSQK